MSPSLSRMMVWVAVAAVASAYGIFVLQFRAQAVVGFTIGFLALALIRGWFAKRSARVFWWGTAVIGGAYLGAASFPHEPPYVFPTTPSLIHLAESLGVFPTTVNQPEELVTFLLDVVKYLKVAHSLVALGIGGLGGALLMATSAVVRAALRRARRPSP